jgi:hypothetical protein
MDIIQPKSKNSNKGMMLLSWSKISHWIRRNYQFLIHVNWPTTKKCAPYFRGTRNWLFISHSVVDFEPKKSWVQAPNRPEKKNNKPKFYQANFFTDSIRNQKPKLRNGILRVILSDQVHKKHMKPETQKTWSFGWAKTREILEVSGENELLCTNL